MQSIRCVNDVHWDAQASAVGTLKNTRTSGGARGWQGLFARKLADCEKADYGRRQVTRV